MIPYTVVIPACNAAATIDETLASVVGQSMPPARVIVVDDGSTDGTGDRVRAFGGVELVRQNNHGPGSATTAGLRLVETELVATVDADDLWLDTKMARQLAAIDGAAAVFSHIVNFVGDPEAGRRGAPYAGWVRSTMLVRTEVARATGSVIDPEGRTGDMIDWLARLQESGNVLRMLDDLLVFRRIHPGSLTYGRPAQGNRGYLQVVRAAMLRRRARES